MSEGPSFRPAKPRGWVIRAVQTFLRFDLAWRNRLRLGPRDLDALRALPRGAGVILAANHADETDFKACLDLSRRSGRRFLFMMNREAFDEGYGIAGWVAPTPRRLLGRTGRPAQRGGEALRH